jgi:hypothetical protein
MKPGWPGAAQARPQDCQMLPPQPLRRQAMGRRGGVLHGRSGGVLNGRSGGRRRLELQFILAGIYGGLVTRSAMAAPPDPRRAEGEGERGEGVMEDKRERAEMEVELDYALEHCDRTQFIRYGHGGGGGGLRWMRPACSVIVVGLGS